MENKKGSEGLTEEEESLGCYPYTDMDSDPLQCHSFAKWLFASSASHKPLLGVPILLPRPVVCA